MALQPLSAGVLVHLESHRHNSSKSLHFSSPKHVLGAENLSWTLLRNFSETPRELGAIMISIFLEVVTEFQRGQVTSPQRQEQGKSVKHQSPCIKFLPA